jgi:Zn-dependent protease
MTDLEPSASQDDTSPQGKTSQPPPLPNDAAMRILETGAFFQEQRALRQREAAAQERQALHAEAYDILAEKLNARTSSRSWRKKALILLGTLLAFILWLILGGAESGRSLLVDSSLLLAVLFFHELGHLLAMKLFGYQDVTMFFIPFFGAAVTGRKAEVTPWQEALMILAGPLPGIFVGVFLMVYSELYPSPLMKDAAFMLLGLNVINLFPIKPLDGGKFFEIVLFCRWRWTSMLFTAFSLIGFAWVLIDLLEISAIFVGIMTLFELMGSWHRYKVNAAIGRQAKEAVLQPDGTVTLEHASMVFDSVISAFAPTQMKPQGLATWALLHFQTRVQKAPGAMVSVGLLVLYLFPLVLIGGGILAIVVLKDHI